MNSIAILSRLPTRIPLRALCTSSPLATPSHIQQRRDNRAYNIPLRNPTMDDMMEPYGPWKVAYEAEKAAANRQLLLGIVTFSATLFICAKSGVFDPLIMPNLDNIMEETEGFKEDTEGRVTV